MKSKFTQKQEFSSQESGDERKKRWDTEIIQLRDAYIQAGVVGQKSLNDAGHVAAATIARADAIVSWNFKQIVRLDKMNVFFLVSIRVCSIFTRKSKAIFSYIFLT